MTIIVRRVKIHDFQCETDEIEKYLEDVLIDVGYVDIVIPGAVYVSPYRNDGDMNDMDYSKWFSQRISLAFDKLGIVVKVEVVEMIP
jgi:hypothetical protein